MRIQDISNETLDQICKDIGEDKFAPEDYRRIALYKNPTAIVKIEGGDFAALSQAIEDIHIELGVNGSAMDEFIIIRGNASNNLYLTYGFRHGLNQYRLNQEIPDGELGLYGLREMDKNKFGGIIKKQTLWTKAKAFLKEYFWI